MEDIIGNCTDAIILVNSLRKKDYIPIKIRDKQYFKYDFLPTLKYIAKSIDKRKKKEKILIVPCKLKRAEKYIKFTQRYVNKI